jgi:23S rRNA-/tRNA-specific pseudouridylate synthase
LVLGPTSPSLRENRQLLVKLSLRKGGSESQKKKTAMALPLALGKASSVKAFLRVRVGRMPAAVVVSTRVASGLSAGERAPIDRSHGPPAAPGVLYVDRGVIVLNKPPGLVSQGCTSTARGTAALLNETNDRATMQQQLTPESAFNDVLDGTNI